MELPGDTDFLNEIEKRIEEEEEQEKYKSPKATPVQSIFPVFKYDYNDINKIANSHLISQKNQNNQLERLLGTKYKLYTDIKNKPPIENTYQYERITTIDDGDIVYIKDFLRASTEYYNEICDSQSCNNPYGFGKVKKNDYGAMMLVHFGIFDDKNCIFLVPKHFLTYHIRPSIIQNEWLISNDMEAFRLKNEQLSISGRSLFGSETSEKPIMPLYRGPDTNLNENPDLETAFQMPANFKRKNNEKGGFSKTIKNNKNINNKTLKAGGNTTGKRGSKAAKSETTHKIKPSFLKEIKNKKKIRKIQNVGNLLIKLDLLSQDPSRRPSVEDINKLKEKYEIGEGFKLFHKFYTFGPFTEGIQKSVPAAIGFKQGDIYLLFLSNKKRIQLNKPKK